MSSQEKPHNTKRESSKMGMVGHTGNLSTQEAEPGGSQPNPIM